MNKHFSTLLESVKKKIWLKALNVFGPRINTVRHMSKDEVINKLSVVFTSGMMTVKDDS